MPLTVIANIHAKPDHETLVRTELEKLVEPTRKEAGCRQYDLHINNDAPGHFMFYENWDSRELWQAHMKAPHIAAYLEATDGAVAQFILSEMKRVA